VTSSLDILAALLERLTETLGATCALRKQMRAGALHRDALRAKAEAELLPLLADAPRLAAHPWIPRRLVDLALDDLLSERMAPPLALPLAHERLADDARLHGLVFSAFPHITNELYPLLVDAAVAELEGCWRGLALGVHVDWLRDGRPTRAIIYDVETNSLIEADLDDAPRLATAQALMLNLRAEGANHARIEAALHGARLLNPLAGARRLDDKTDTARVWSSATLPTPRCLLVAEETPDAETDAFRASLGPRAIRKPVDGTEGRGVEIIDAEGSPIAEPPLGCAGCGHADAPKPEPRVPTPESRPYLLCEERGNLRVASSCGPVRLTVRLNVTWDGRSAIAESGYAQVAASPHSVASVGRGGRIAALTGAWDELCTEDGTPFAPTREDWDRLLAVAQSGVAALATALRDDMPALVGVDLLLDLDEAGHLAPVLLEANPRPAGLSHARLLTPDGQTREPGVSARLWAILAP
jgi:hypothetical protein